MKNFALAIGGANLISLINGCPSERFIQESQGVGTITTSYPHSGLLGNYNLRTVFWYPKNISQTKDKKPLVYISHGFASFPRGHIDLGKRLASEGYIVASPSHYGDKLIIAGLYNETYSGVDRFLPADYNIALQYMQDIIENVSDIPEIGNITPLEFMRYLLNGAFSGELEEHFPEANEMIRNIIEYRLNESDSAMKGIEKTNQDNFILKEKIDMDKITLLGHSLGGYTVLGMSGAYPYSKDKAFDFRGYQNKIKLVIPQSPVSGIFTKAEIDNCYSPRFWMVGELDKEQFNSVPEKLFRNGTNIPEHFLRIDNGGHDIYDNVACLYGAGENVSQPIIDFLGENTFELFNSQTYLDDCGDYQRKQDLIYDYVKASCDIYARGDMTGNERLHVFREGVLDLWHKE